MVLEKGEQVRQQRGGPGLPWARLEPKPPELCALQLRRRDFQPRPLRLLAERPRHGRSRVSRS